MSTTFQVGDTVRVLPTGAQPLAGLHANTHVTVEHADETHVRVSGSIYEWHARRFELVKRADATPTPLDPSKVAITLKGGDYIEAESDGAKIGGRVSHVNENGFVAIEHVGTFAIHHITASPQDGYRFFILTAHQPAPEPEPKWADGTFGDALVDGVSVRGFIANGGESFVFPLPDGGYHEVGHGAYSDFAPDEPRPLPTREQIAVAIARADSHESQSNLYLKNADAVLALLRGESR